MGRGGVKIMKRGVRIKSTPARERGTRQYLEWSSLQWYTIKEENWISSPLNGSCKSIMQMKASIDGGWERASCLNPSGTLSGSMSGEHPPLCRGTGRGLIRKLNFRLTGQKSTAWVWAYRGLTWSFRLEMWRSGVKGGGRRFSIFSSLAPPPPHPPRREGRQSAAPQLSHWNSQSAAELGLERRVINQV